MNKNNEYIYYIIRTGNFVQINQKGLILYQRVKDAKY